MITKIAEANELASNLITQLPALFNRVVVADPHSFAEGLSQYTLTVINDEENGTKDEPDYGTILPYTFFNQTVKTVEDVMVHYLHVMAHKKCKVLWTMCPTDFSLFQRHEIDIIEEMYNQRLLYVVAPQYHSRFLDCITQYETLIGLPQSPIREEIMETLSVPSPKDNNTVLRALHTLLYSLDPLQPGTFSTYISLWYHLIASCGYREKLQEF